MSADDSTDLQFRPLGVGGAAGPCAVLPMGLPNFSAQRFGPNGNMVLIVNRVHGTLYCVSLCNFWWCKHG